MKRIISIVLSFLCALTVMTACDNTNNGLQNSNQTTPKNPVLETVTEHKVEGTLHKVSVTPTEKAFVVSGTSEYKIVVPQNADKKLIKASEFLSKYIGKATECYLPVINATEWNENDKYIVIGDDNLFTEAGLTMPSDDIGPSGYYIKSKGNSVFVKVNTIDGYHRAVLSLLKHLVGYEMYSEDTVAFTKDGKTIPDMEIIERPDYDYYILTNYMTGEAQYGMGVDAEAFIRVNNKMYHNSFEYLPPTQYSSVHPEWYSVGEKQSDGTYLADGTQLCYTARGNEAKLTLMINTVVDKVIETIDTRPDLANITITQQDTPRTCSCDACKENLNKYGTAAGSIIKFMNRVDDEVQARLQRRADESGEKKREVFLLFFAYHKSEKAPVKTVNGQLVPVDDSVKCNANVGVYIAPIYTRYDRSLYEEENADTAKTINGWSKVSQKLYMWLYNTNFANYLYPYNSYVSTVESYRLCKANGAFFMYNQGQYNQTNVTAFGKFKEYTNAKACFDVNLDFGSLQDDFFANYFRDAEKPMREFYDGLQLHLASLEQKYPELINGDIYNEIEESRFWEKKRLDGWLELCDEAYEKIEKYKTTDASLYESLRKHILLETIFPRFALLRLYSTSFTSAEFNVEAKQFKSDCALLGISQLWEHDTLDGVFTDWGV